MKEVPFNLIKKVLYVQDSTYKYSIDEDGNGIAMIDGHILLFEVNHYGEIIGDSIRFKDEQ